jgi:hypothetical protein
MAAKRNKKKGGKAQMEAEEKADREREIYIQDKKTTRKK